MEDEIIRRENSAETDMIDNDEPESSLWVDKFHPRRFTELLSDDVSLIL